MGEIVENVESNPKRKFTIILISMALLFIAFMFALWIWGSAGIAKVFTGFFIFLIVLAVIGLVFLLIIKLLFPPKPNMLSVLKRRLTEGATMRAPERDVKVYLRGDSKDYERRFIGMLKGISETIIPPEVTEIKKDGKSIITTTGKAQRFLFLVVKNGVFQQGKIIGVLRDHLTNPSMDEIYINDNTLTPPFGGVYFPSMYSENSTLTDIPVSNYVKRYILEGFLKDLKVIVDDAVQSNPQHQKNLEQKGVFERIGEAGENE